METPDESRFVVNSVPTKRARDLYERFLAGDTSYDLAKAEGLSQARVFDLVARMRIVHDRLANEQQGNSTA